MLQIVNLGRACRNESNIKTRQPIGKMYVGSTESLPNAFIEIVAEELNVKEVEFTSDATEFISYAFKPQMRTLGPKYGKMLNAIRTALTELDGIKAMSDLNKVHIKIFKITHTYHHAYRNAKAKCQKSTQKNKT